MQAFTIVMALAMLIVVILAMREVQHFRMKRETYGLRRLTLRLTTSGMLFFLLCSILIGVRVFGLEYGDGIVQLFIAFWLCIFLLTGAILCLVIADFRMADDVPSGQHARVSQEEIQRIIAEHQATHPKD